MNRRELLLALLAGGSGVRRAEGAILRSSQAPSTTELVLCGWAEVFILAVDGDAAPSPTKVWSWRAADSPEIPASLHAAFRTTDDCKPVDDGRRILISSSAGAIALVDRETRRALFHARVTNAHSIERLPDGRLAAAASVSAAGTGDRIVIFDQASGRELASDALRSAHGLVWDAPRRLLWALGGDVLRAYDIGDAGGAARLARTFEVALPDAGGHDLTAVPDSPRLFLSTERRCWYFDREARQIVPHDTLAAEVGIKSYSISRSGRIAYVQAEGTDWWAEHVHFQRPDGTLRLAGERLYKARWI
jgi:hypothetical protein